MTIVRRVFVSMPADQWLSPAQNDLKWGIVDEIEKLGYQAEIFFDPRGKPGLAAAKAWSAREADAVFRRCIGAIVIGMPRWRFPTVQGDVQLPTEFCHYEGAIAYTLRLPLLVLVQDGVLRRVVFDNSYDGFVGVIQPDADRSWLSTENFRMPFGYWRHALEERRDIFLGYCSSSTKTAIQLKRYLQGTLATTVLDWRTDFPPGRSILAQITEATARCSAAIFLFTKDDQLLEPSDKDKAVPRDNVVFEAGYFINAKGKDHVLIIRESGAKMPADLGGDIYLEVDEKKNVRPIAVGIRRFLSAL